MVSQEHGNKTRENMHDFVHGTADCASRSVCAIEPTDKGEEDHPFLTAEEVVCAREEGWHF